MKARHILLALSILGTGLAGWTVAEPGWGGGPGHRGGRGHLLKALELSEDQQAQFKALRQQHREAMKPQREAIREQVEAGTLTREEAREQMRAAMESHRAEVEKILTPEQLQKLEELRANRPKRGQQSSAGDEQGEVPKIPTEGTTVPTAVESQSWGKVKDSVK